MEDLKKSIAPRYEKERGKEKMIFPNLKAYKGDFIEIALGENQFDYSFPKYSKGGTEALSKKEGEIEFPRGSASMVKYFRFLLDHLGVEFPEGLPLLEIGGPTIGATERDIYYSQPSFAVIENIQPRSSYYELLKEDDSKDSPVRGTDWFCMQQEKLSFCGSIKEAGDKAIQVLDKAIDEDDFDGYLKGEFGLVTAYGVFGNENATSFSSADWGPDMSSNEKRMKILNNIASVMKPGGLLFLSINNCSKGQRYWGLDEEESLERIDEIKEQEKERKLNFQPGFEPKELMEAGFSIITKLPYRDGMFVCQYARN